MVRKKQKPLQAEEPSLEARFRQENREKKEKEKKNRFFSWESESCWTLDTIFRMLLFFFFFLNDSFGV